VVKVSSLWHAYFVSLYEGLHHLMVQQQERSSPDASTRVLHFPASKTVGYITSILHQLPSPRSFVIVTENRLTPSLTKGCGRGVSFPGSSACQQSGFKWAGGAGEWKQNTWIIGGTFAGTWVALIPPALTSHFISPLYHL
jgi:hypothetical protein